MVTSTSFSLSNYSDFDNLYMTKGSCLLTKRIGTFSRDLENFMKL